MYTNYGSLYTLEIKLMKSNQEKWLILDKKIKYSFLHKRNTAETAVFRAMQKT